MALKPIVAYGVQLFILLKGKLAQGRYIECKSVGEACRIAEERVRTGRAIGAAAFTRTVVDRDYDDGDGPTALVVFGRVPPGVADALPF